MNPAAGPQARPRGRRPAPGGAPRRRRARSTRAGEPRPAPPPIPVLIDRILRSEKFGVSVVHVTSVPEQPAEFRDIERPLPESLRRACADLGIDRFVSHQAEAIDAIRSGGDVLTVTPTASGKSLIYLLPTMEAALTRPGARSLSLFP